MAANSGAAALGCDPRPLPEGTKTAEEVGDGTWPRDGCTARKSQQGNCAERDASKEAERTSHGVTAEAGDIENKKVFWVVTIAVLFIVGIVFLAFSVYCCTKSPLEECMFVIFGWSLQILFTCAAIVYELLIFILPHVLLLRFVIRLLWYVCKRRWHPLVYLTISASFYVLLILDKKAALETFTRGLRSWGTLLGQSLFLGCVVTFLEKI